MAPIPFLICSKTLMRVFLKATSEIIFFYYFSVFLFSLCCSCFMLLPEWSRARCGRLSITCACGCYTCTVCETCRNFGESFLSDRRPGRYYDDSPATPSPTQELGVLAPESWAQHRCKKKVVTSKKRFRCVSNFPAVWFSEVVARLGKELKFFQGGRRRSSDYLSPLCK